MSYFHLWWLKLQDYKFSSTEGKKKRNHVKINCLQHVGCNLLMAKYLLLGETFDPLNPAGRACTTSCGSQPSPTSSFPGLGTSLQTSLLVPFHQCIFMDFLSMDFPIPFWAGWCCLHNLQRQPLPDLTCRVIKALFFCRCWRFYYLSNEFQNHVWLVLKCSFGLSKAQNFKSTGQCTSLFCWGFPAHDCAHESPCPVWGYRPFQCFQLYQTTDFSHLPFLWVSPFTSSPTVNSVPFAQPPLSPCKDIHGSDATSTCSKETMGDVDQKLALLETL